MFERVECPNPAYSQLIKTGLAERILKKREVVKGILSGYIYGDEDSSGFEWLFEKAEKTYFDVNRKISDESEQAREILEFQVDLDEKNYGAFSEKIKDLCLKYPGFLTQAVLGSQSLDYERFGFSSRKSLEEAVVSFCYSEKLEFSETLKSEWIWRRGNWKNEIAQNIHGDLYVSQMDISGKEYSEKGLFEDMKFFDVIKQGPDSRGLSAYQDWSQFLLAKLRYAREIGQEKCSDIVEWKDVLASIGGGVGTNTAECEFGSSDFGFETIFFPELWSDRNEPKLFPLAVYASGETSYVPYVQGENLIYLLENEKGDFEFDNEFFKKKKFKKVLEYTPEDLPDVLRGTYKYFARDRGRLPKIIEGFLSRRFDSHEVLSNLNLP